MNLVLIKKSKHWSKKKFDYKNENKMFRFYITKSDIIKAGEEFLKRNSKINILTVGHMTNAKGFNDVIKVIPKVAQKYPNVIFNFAGELRTGERGVFFNQFSEKRLKYEDPVKAERQIIIFKI